MTTTTQNIPTDNSFGFTSSKSQTTCNICKRLLYSFEEILVCQLCHGAYHWRCVRPETISHYDDSATFICDRCNDSTETTSITTTTNPSYRLSNGGMKIKSPDSSEINYRDFASIPSKLSTIPTKDTTVVNAVRYFEEKQQQQQQPQPYTMSQTQEFNEHLSSQKDGQYIDGSKTKRQYQEQQNHIGSGNENTTAAMFQANYQYTPLQEYAALRSDPTTNDTHTYVYQAPPSTDTDYQLSSRYGVGDGLTYADEAYESTKSHLYGSTLNNSTSYTSPTSDNLAVHNRQQHFSSTTNLNVNGTLSRRQQQQNIPKSSFTQSTPYLSQIHDDDPSTFKSSCQQKDQQRYTDRHSVIGSDSGIVIVHTNQPRRKTDDNQIVERKLTNLVQKLGRQLETDTQHLSEKLESKLKNLEHMINQQTFVIREQDGVIEHLKTKISKIETERDNFRDRLSVREQGDKKNQITTEIDKLTYHKTFEQDDEQQTLDDASTNRKFSNSSSVTTDQSKRSSKKLPAPRIDRNESFVTNEDESTIAKLINTFPSNPELVETDSSSSSVAALLVAAVPLTENPPAANRLDTIIRQTNIDDTTQPTSLYYNQVDDYPYDSKQFTEQTTKEQEELFTNVRDDDEQIGRIITSDMQLSRLSSSSSSSSASTSIPTGIDNLTSTNNYTLPTKNSNIHRSLELIPRRTPQNEEELRPTTKTTSLELYQKPVRYDEPTLVFLTPQESTQAASQYQNVIKGWLRKQNRASILKRVERYYCVLLNNIILMHKQENDRVPKKRVNLKGAKVLQYDDQKYGPSLDLTWSPQANRTKRYHLYFNNQHEAQQWLIAIQNAMDNLSDSKRQ